MSWIVKQVWQHAARCDIKDLLIYVYLRMIFLTSQRQVIGSFVDGWNVLRIETQSIWRHH
jgi:hypothetical protein